MILVGKRDGAPLLTLMLKRCEQRAIPACTMEMLQTSIRLSIRYPAHDTPCRVSFIHTKTFFCLRRDTGGESSET